MNTYVVLLRGINVGGKNKISMMELRSFLESLGLSDVRTYIQSGNVLLKSKLDAHTISQKIEENMPKQFKLDSAIIKALVLSFDQLQAVTNNKPSGFGEQPDKYHSDVIFLIGIDVSQAIAIFNPREGVDKIWPGKAVIYSQRLSALRTKSRLSKIIGTPLYKSMTIRSWSTTTKLLELLEEMEHAAD